MFRTKTNYEIDLNTAKISLTGINKNSIFNKLPNFHINENMSVDIMHDIFEGVAHYWLYSSLQYFINEKKYIDLFTLNNRKQLFDYGEFDIKNKSPPIKTDHIKHLKLSMTSSEMVTFLKYIILIIGDLIPINNSVRKYILF